MLGESPEFTLIKDIYEEEKKTWSLRHINPWGKKVFTLKTFYLVSVYIP